VKPYLPGLLEGMLTVRSALILSGLFFAASVFIMWPGIIQYITSGEVTMHWSRMITGSFLLTAMFLTLVFMVVMKTASIWQRELSQRPRG